MNSNEIFERLMTYRNDSVRGNQMLDEYFDAILYSVAKVLDLSNEQATALAGEASAMQSEPTVAIKPAIELTPSAYEITDGYVGSFGKTYKQATEQTLTEAIAYAAQRHNVTTEAIKQRLVDGQSVEWCDSPNHYYDHGKGVIRLKRQPQKVQLVKCSCGHSVPRSQVMSASLGTSCPDCYDRMSA